MHRLGDLHICSSGVHPKEIHFSLIFEKIESEPVRAEKTALGLLTAAPLLWALRFLLLQSYAPSPRFQLAITTPTKKAIKDLQGPLCLYCLCCKRWPEVNMSPYLKQRLAQEERERNKSLSSAVVIKIEVEIYKGEHDHLLIFQRGTLDCKKGIDRHTLWVFR